jgi:hypothetical protein
MSTIYAGGVKQIRIATDDAFTSAVTIDGAALSKEGNTFPTVEDLTETLASEQDAQSGVRIPFALRVVKMASADAQTLKGYAETLTPVFVEFETPAGLTEVLRNVIPRVHTSPVAVTGRFGVVRIAGEAVAGRESLAHTISAPA